MTDSEAGPPFTCKQGWNLKVCNNVFICSVHLLLFMPLMQAVLAATPGSVQAVPAAAPVLPAKCKQIDLLLPANCHKYFMMKIPLLQYTLSNFLV